MARDPVGRDKEARTAWWERLPAGIREQVDGYAHHGDRIARVPDSPLGPESPARRAEGVAGRVGTECAPAHIPRGAAERYLGVPFQFAGPDIPDDEAPRWRV